jgi:hypothetical protein
MSAFIMNKGVEISNTNRGCSGTFSEDGDLFWIAPKFGNVPLNPRKSSTLIQKPEISFGEWNVRRAGETEHLNNISAHLPLTASVYE